MNYKYLGRLNLRDALSLQEDVYQDLRRGMGAPLVMGFETNPVISLGLRASPSDLLFNEQILKQHDFEVLRTDRGGQTTLHNPGQLVIFPVLRFAPLTPREWVRRLSVVTQNWLRNLAYPCQWDEQRPGLYSPSGKVAAFGLRFRHGISIHGLAINVHNDLEPFSWIVPCGRTGARVDRLPSALSLEQLFSLWVREFEKVQATKSVCKLTTTSIS